MTNEREVKLGSQVRDVVSGFEGIVSGKTLVSNGNVRFAVSPVTKDPSVLPDSFAFDKQSLIWIGEGVEERALAEQDYGVKVLDRVWSKINPQDVGIVTDMSVHLNGCVNLGVERETFDPKKHEESAFVVAAHLVEVVGKLETVKVTKVTGGPVARVGRQAVAR